MKPDLLVFCHAFNIDGATMMVLHALSRPDFREQYGNITVLSATPGEMEEEFRAVGVKTQVLPVLKLGSYMQMILPRTMVQAMKLFGMLRRNNVVWINSADHPSYFFWLLTRFRKRGLYYFHEGLRSPFSRHFIYGAKGASIERSVGSGRVRLAFPSQTTVKQGKSLFPALDVERIPYGLTLNDVTKVERDFSGKIDFVSIGWICARKGQEFMRFVLKKLDEVLAESPGKYRDYQFTFVGINFGAHHDFMVRMLEFADPTRVRFVEMMDNSKLNQTLGKYHCLVSNSFNEALPVNVMEMLRSGGIVVGARCEGQDELIVDDVTGWSYDVADFPGLLDCMLKVLEKDNAQKLEQMSEAAARHVSTNYSADQFVGRLRTCIGEVG